MILVSFLLPVLYWPGVAEMSNTPRWCLLSLVPLIWLAKKHPFTIGHKFGLAWLALGLLSLCWAVSFLDGAQALIRFVMIASVFCVASQMTERQIKWNIGAFALGVAANSALAVWQELNPQWNGIYQVTGPAGLFMNRNYLAEAGLLTLVACWSVRYWLLGLFALPAAVLPGSRGVYLAMTLTGFAWLWRAKRRLAIVLGVCAAIAFALYFSFIQSHDRQQTFDARVAYYGNTAAMIADHPMGVGIGGFWAAYPPYWDRWVDDKQGYKLDQRPRTPHNDALTVMAETGIIGFLLLAFVFLRAWLTQHPLRYVVLAFLAIGLVNFPLYVVNTAYLCALVAGYLCHGRHFVRSRLMDWGDAVFSGQQWSRRYSQVVSLLPSRKLRLSPRA